MSWLSELFGGGGGEDPRAVQQREQQRIDEENRRAEEAAAAQRLVYEQLLAQQKAEADAAREERAAAAQKEDERFAAQQADAKAAAAPTELDLKQQALDEQDLADEMARKEIRRSATGQVNQLFQPEFEQTWAPGTTDDPYIEETFGKERARADEYLNNLLKRKVITQSGYTGGTQALEEQAPDVRGQLTDVGDALIEAQRGKLTGLRERALGTASTLEPGQTFDPGIYDKELHDTTDEFGTSFGGKFAAAAPDDLFDTTKIQQKAGAAQGAQNLAFDPGAVAGDIDSFGDPEDPLKKKRQPVAVF
jgi:hypothetical protein